jgi:rhodanese-related sulfurtransferase
MTAAVSAVSPQQVEQLRQQGKAFELIDVRTPAEFRALHAESAKNYPLDTLHGSTLRELADRAANHTVYLICQKGSRGKTACEQLRASGAENIANIEGGTLAWEAAGLPVVRGKQTMSLERQVRIVAGSLVVVGSALAWFVHPAFVGLSAFVGAGLVFAGITDTCGMGMLLAKMPWNRT